MKPQNQNNKNDLFRGFDKRLKKKNRFSLFGIPLLFLHVVII